MVSMNRRRKTITYSVVAIALFSWGYLAHRNQVFPYQLARFAAVQMDLIPAKTFESIGGNRLEIGPQVAPLDQLTSLPYVQAQFDPNSALRGVVSFDTARAQPGMNFYNPYREDYALLMDMDGNTVHEWKYPYPGGFWHHAELLEDGSVLVVIKDLAIIKLDRCSNLIWSYDTRAHHGVWVDGDGRIYILTRSLADAPEVHSSRKILDDRIAVLTASGLVEDELSILTLLRNSGYAYLLRNVEDMAFDESDELDPLHTNHVEAFDGRLAGQSTLFEQGNLLISIKQLNAIAIVDGATQRIIWLWGPNNLVRPHHPRLLHNGHILVFDNGTDRSRVVELDPATRRIVWSYEKGTDFFSSNMGSVQRLPNGNTLITESQKGYVFEVDPAGEIVWKFANPEVNEQGERLNVWRMTRLPPTTGQAYASPACADR
jgi:hypothetical protein